MHSYHIKKILFPTDFSAASTNALQFAIALATKSNAGLILLNVVQLPLLVSNYSGPGDFDILPKTILEAARESLAKMAVKILEEEKLIIETYVLQGLLHENIIRASLLYSADIIVMGTGGELGLVHLFGSDAHKIVKHSNIPVLTIHQSVKYRKISKILFPVNNDPLTLQKVDEIICLARIFHAEIQVIGIVDDIGKTWAVEEHIMQVDRWLESKKLKHTHKLIHGNNYGNEILKVCNADKEVLLVIASNQDHCMLSLFKDKHDERLVNNAEVPVLSVPVIME